MASSPLAAPDEADRWRHRLVRLVELMTMQPRYRRFRGACELVDGDELPGDRDRAVGFVADWFADRQLCHRGAVDVIQRAFELDADEAQVIMAEHCGTRAAIAIAGEPAIGRAVAHRLVESSSVELRARLAGNGSIPREVLGRLLEDPDPYVRASAEWNPVFGRTLETSSDDVARSTKRFLGGSGPCSSSSGIS